MVMGKTILMDARTGSDFTIDAVWAGLVDRLGWENVIDWPPADKHREGIPQVTGDVDKDYGAERRSLCYTPHHAKFPRYFQFQINDMLKAGEIDRIFIDERKETYLYYCQTVARFTNVPVVVIAGHDRFWNDSPQVVQQMYGKNLEAMFLDNWRPEYNDIKRAYRMHYAVNFDHLWDHENRQKYLADKIYDICFMGYNSNSDRAAYVDHLVKKYGHEGNCLFVEKRPNTVECFLPKREYFKKIAQSRICINLNGAAECGKALRFYEIPYVGSYMLSQRHDHHGAGHSKGFAAGWHCDYFSSIPEMDAMIAQMLADPVTREERAKRGHELTMKKHTARARVDYIYEHLGR